MMDLRRSLIKLAESNPAAWTDRVNHQTLGLMLFVQASSSGQLTTGNIPSLPQNLNSSVCGGDKHRLCGQHRDGQVAEGLRQWWHSPAVELR